MAAKRVLTDKEKELIKEKYLAGDGLLKIGKYIGIRSATVSALIKEMGLWQPRRNLDYKHGISDEMIVEKFNELGSIRATSRCLFNLNSNYISLILKENGIQDINPKEIYARLEKHKEEIVAMHQNPEIGRQEIKSKLPKTALRKKGVKESEIVEKYKKTNNVDVTAKFFNLNLGFVYKILKKNGIVCGLDGKHFLLQKDKDSIIHRYLVLKESCSEIAKSYGVWRTTILDLLKANNIKINKTVGQLIDEKILNNKYKITKWASEGITKDEIAKKLNIGRKKILRICKIWGVEVLNYKYKESGLERTFKSLLSQLNINFSQSYKINSRIYDFYLPDYNLLIEINGDYWHANPKIHQNKKLLPCQEISIKKRYY